MGFKRKPDLSPSYIFSHLPQHNSFHSLSFPSFLPSFPPSLLPSFLPSFNDYYILFLTAYAQWSLYLSTYLSLSIYLSHFANHWRSQNIHQTTPITITNHKGFHQSCNSFPRLYQSPPLHFTSLHFASSPLLSTQSLIMHSLHDAPSSNTPKWSRILMHCGY